MDWLTLQRLSAVTDTGDNIVHGGITFLITIRFIVLHQVVADSVFDPCARIPVSELIQ